MDKKRILIADDHPLFRAGLKLAIEADRAFEVVGEAADGETALQLITETVPHVVVLDLNMPQLNGFEVAGEMRRRQFAGDIVMLTMHNEEAMFNKAMSLGVSGYVLKDSAASDIVTCLHAISRGHKYTSPELTKFLFRRAMTTEQQTELTDALTPTERKVLGLIAEYKTSRDIADQLFISVRTVENHRNSICSKLDIHGSHSLIKYALRHQSDI
jgi:DNA-binding NarL/FixJ family response regulator